jgi:hypothetical protein
LAVAVVVVVVVVVVLLMQENRVYQFRLQFSMLALARFGGACFPPRQVAAAKTTTQQPPPTNLLENAMADGALGLSAMLRVVHAQTMNQSPTPSLFDA